ncbi:MAG: hypothetical protein V1720_08440 [bacterium]
MKLFIRIFFPMLAIFILGLILFAAPLPDPFPERFSYERNLLTWLVVGCTGVMFLIYILRYLTKHYKQIGSVFDPLCLKWGLNSEDYPVYGKHYFGNMNGRKIDVYYTPWRRRADPLLNVYLSINTKIRMAVSEQKPLKDCVDCPKVETDYPELNYLQIYCENIEWARKFFAKPENRNMVSKLITGWKEKGKRELYLQPGKLWLYSHPYYDVTFDIAEEWFDALPLLADAVEKINTSTN